jgi:hypothetical protein
VTVSHTSYSNNEDLSWTLSPPPGVPVGQAVAYVVHFTTFNTESGYDFVYVEATGAPSYSARCSGATCADVAVVSATGITIRFHSDYSITAAGFVGTVTFATMAPSSVPTTAPTGPSLSPTPAPPATAATAATVAGTGTAGSTGDSGTAVAARLNSPQGVAFSPALNGFYVADTKNARLRLVDTNGIIAPYSLTPAPVAPSGMAMDVSSNVYLTDPPAHVVFQSYNPNYVGGGILAGIQGVSGFDGDGKCARTVGRGGHRG